MKLAAALGGTLGSIFGMFAVIGAFVWVVRKASVLMKTVHR